jgi:hypothetical protein
VLERKPASERRLAEEQHAAHIFVADRHFTEGGERNGVDRSFAKVGECACQ